MKKIVLTFILLFTVLTLRPQAGGFINLNDFGLPTYPYQHSRFWLRGSTPAGANPVIEFYGLLATKLYTDSLIYPKLALRNDTGISKLLWIDNKGFFRAVSSPYLKVTDTTGKWKSNSYVPTWSSITGKPTFSTVATSGDYNDLSNLPNLSQYYLNTNPNNYITQSQARASLSSGTGISYNSSTGVITNSSPDQTITLSAGSGIAVTGTYPSFTVANTSLNSVTNYNSSGIISITKRWHGVITPNSTNGYSIDISSAGFTNIINVQIIASRNTGVVSSCPQVSVRTVSTTSITVNITEVNTATINLLGINVLSGLPSIFASITGLTLYVLVEGN